MGKTPHKKKGGERSSPAYAVEGAKGMGMEEHTQRTAEKEVPSAGAVVEIRR